MNFPFWIVTAGWSLVAVAGDLILPPQLPDNLRSDNREPALLTPCQDGMILKSAEADVQKNGGVVMAWKFYTASYERAVPTPLKIDGFDTFYDVALSGPRPVAIGSRGGVTIAATLSDKNSWQPLDLPKTVVDHPLIPSKLLPVLIPSRTSVAFLVNDTLWWQEGKGWRHRWLLAPSMVPKELTRQGLGTVQYLDGTKLYTGLDRGEWGGALAVLDLASDSSPWQRLSGMKKTGLTGIACNDPVHAIAGTGPNELWVGAGLAHRMVLRDDLFKNTPSKGWTSIFGTYGRNDHHSLEFRVPSELTHLTVDSQGRLFILASKSGVYEVLPDSLREIMPIEFSPLSKQRVEAAGGFSSTLASYPKAVSFAANGDLYLTTVAFGTLVFRNDGKRWTAKQIMIDR